MRIVFAGSPAVAVPTLDGLIAQGHQIVGVLSQPDAPTGRGRKLAPSAVSARALELGLPLWRPERASEVEAEIVAARPDLGVVVAFGQLIRPSLLAVPTHGWINLHFSELPRWRGAAPVQRAIMAGDQTIGTTVFRLVPELDAGPVWACETTPIGAEENAGQLLDRLAVSGVDVVARAIVRIEAGELPADQPTDGLTYAAKLDPEDGRLDLTRPAEELDRQIRGVTPAPGAWSTWRGERFKIAAATITEHELPPGRLAATKRELLVGTGTTALRLDTVRAFGKKEMAGADWARGVTLAADETLGAEDDRA